MKRPTILLIALALLLPIALAENPFATQPTGAQTSPLGSVEGSNVVVANPFETNMMSKLNILTIIIVVVLAILVAVLIVMLRMRKSQSMGNLLSVENYIVTNLKKGYSEKQLREVLLREGWKKAQVNKAFRDAKALMMNK